MQTQELKDKLIQDLTKCGIRRAYVHCGSLANLYIIFGSQESRSHAINVKIKELAKPFMKSSEAREDIIVSDMTGYTDRLTKLLPKGYEALFEAA